MLLERRKWWWWVALWVDGLSVFVEVRRRSFLVKMDGGLDVYDRMAGFSYKPPFCERMLEGKMQMRETEIPKIKNQEDA